MFLVEIFCLSPRFACHEGILAGKHWQPFAFRRPWDIRKTRSSAWSRVFATLVTLSHVLLVETVNDSKGSILSYVPACVLEC